MFRRKDAVTPRKEKADKRELQDAKANPLRADARLKMTAVVQAATEVFAAHGVDAPVRQIAAKAGVGLGTVYRHFPHRSDLIAAVMKTQVDECADAATMLAEKYEPAAALARWLHRLMDFFGTKRGLAAALHSGNSAYSALPSYFMNRMHTAMSGLIEAAVTAKVIRPGIKADDLLFVVGSMCQGPNGKEPEYARAMLDVLIDGLRYGARDQRP